MSLTDNFTNYLKLHESEINSRYNNTDIINILKQIIPQFCTKNNITDDDKELLYYELNNDEFFIEDCKEVLSNKHNLTIFNKLAGKNYTIDSLHQQISKLICGYLYIELPKYLKETKEEINNAPGAIIRILNYTIYNIINNFKITDQFCKEHFNCSLNDFNKYAFNISEFMTIDLLLSKDYNELYDDFAKMVQETDNKVAINRRQYLLELDNDDKIGQYYGEIDYDPHDVDKRDAPIVIYRDLNNIDHVLIGRFGQNHIDIYPNEYNKDYMSECYYYKPCAFIEKITIKGYSIDEVTRILINDPRIKKVYLAPGHLTNSKLKRLAKIF